MLVSKFICKFMSNKFKSLRVILIREQIVIQSDCDTRDVTSRVI